MAEGETFGAVLQRYRKTKGLGQTALARKLSMKTRASIGAWEQDLWRPKRVEIVLAIAEALELGDDEKQELLAAYDPVTYPYALKSSVLRNDCYTHEQLPDIYIERSEILASIRALLLENAPSHSHSFGKKTSSLVLHGMGGIGKSVIARALCDDTLLHAAFPNGILLAKLGKKPPFITILRTWIDALGGTVSENEPTIDNLKRILAQLLRERQCLLILDDVWTRSDADVFRVGGQSCRLLLTTRKDELADKLGGQIFRVPLLKLSEAIALLEMWANGSLAEASMTLKKRIIKRLGYLPLAVQLAGAQLRSKAPDVWLATFNVRKLRYRDIETPHDSFEVTFRLSLEELNDRNRQLFVALAIFNEGESIPQAAIKRLWLGLGKLTDEMTAELLDDLSSRALLEVISQDSFRLIRLHDLLHELLSALLGVRHTLEAHQTLLRIYRTTWQGDGWHTANDDGYLYNHLVYHLLATDALDEIKALFADHHWLLVRVPQSEYLHDGYLEDLQCVWEQALIDIRRQIRANQEPSALVEAVRYLLIRASINSLANNYSPALIGRAVEVGLWTLQRALSIAAKIPGIMQSIEVYAALLATSILNQEDRQYVQRLAIKMVRQLAGKQVEAIKCLTPYLTDPFLLEEVLNIALAISDEQYRVFALVALLPYLPSGLSSRAIEQGLKDVLTILSRGERVYAVDDLVLHFTESHLDQFLSTLSSIPIALGRGDVLADLAPYLANSMVESVLECAFVLWEYEQAYALAALAPRLTEEQLERALRAALDFTFEGDKAVVLIALAPYLRSPLLNRAIDAAEAVIEEPFLRAETFVALAPQMNEQMRSQVVKRELKKALRLYDERTQIDVLIALIPLLEETQLVEILAVALTLKDNVSRAELLVALASRSAGIFLTQALETTLALQDKKRRAQLLAALAAQLEGEQRYYILTQALEAARAVKGSPFVTAIGDQMDQAKALIELIPHLEGTVVLQGIEAALALRDERARLLVLGKLAPRLTKNLLKYVLEEIPALKDEEACAEALATLTSEQERDSFLLSVKQTRVVHLVEKILEKKKMAQAWRKADSWPDQERERLMQAPENLLTIEDERERAEKLAKLIPYLTGEQRSLMLKRGIEAAMAVKSEWDRAKALAQFIPFVSNQDILLKPIRQALLHGLESLYLWSRQNVLRGYFCKELFSPPILSPRTLTAIVSLIIEICEEWKWF